MMFLISAANCDISFSMARILRTTFEDCKLIGLAPDGIWPAKGVFDEILEIPFASESNYFEVLSGYIGRYKPNFFIPASEKELGFILDNAVLFKTFETKIISNDSHFLRIFLDKYETYLWLSQQGICVPKTVLLNEIITFDFPVIIKPRRSAGSKNITIVNSEKHLEVIKENIGTEFLDEYVIQEYIDAPNSEFTCATWRFENDFREITFHRKLQGGLTGVAAVVDVPEIKHLLNIFQENINSNFFLNVQLRMKDHQPYVFEVNPRFSSTIMMRHKIGFQDFMWTINKYNNKPIGEWKGPLVGTKIFRISDELIIQPQQQVIA